MSRARSVSQLVGANSALGNTIITGTANVSSTLAAGNTTITGTANVSSTLATGNTSVSGTVSLTYSNATSYTTSTRVGSGLTIYNSSNTNSYAGVEFLTEPTSGNAGICGIAGVSTGGGDSALVFGTRGSSTYAERMRIDASGRVTMPYQPAFSAFKTSLTLPSTTWTTIVYDSCAINRGSHYSTSTGRFTAPVAGYYYFEAIGEGGGGSFHTLISVNGGAGSGIADSAQNWTSSNVSRQSYVLSLTAYDYVYVQHYIDSGRTMTSNRCHFSGFLLG